MPHRRSGPIVTVLFCLLSLMSTARSAIAEVTRIEFTSKEPYGAFRAGDYVIWQGTVRGVLSPQEAIPGIDKAARDERGRVAYSAKIVLLIPAASGAGNGALLVDVPNRGGRITIGPLERANGDIGLSSGWQGDSSGQTAPRPDNDYVIVPVARNPDGSPKPKARAYL